MERYLILTGSLVLLVLGTIHLLYTFFTDKFFTRIQETGDMMKLDSPILTRKTSVWKAWIGFNASHSIGVLFFALINIAVALENFELFQSSNYLLVLDNVMVLFYLFLAKKYWFIRPLVGIFITFICFATATILIAFQ